MVKNLPVNAGDLGLIPGPGRPFIPRSNQVHVPQLLSLHSRAWELQLPKPAARGGTATGSLHATAKEQPHSPQLERSLSGSEDPAQPKQEAQLLKKKERIIRRSRWGFKTWLCYHKYT